MWEVGGVRICHVGRDIERTGGGEVLKQLAAGMVAEHEVVVLTDTPAARAGLPPSVRVVVVPGGPTLLEWRPRSRAGWHARHAVQIAWFTAAGTVLAFALRLRGFAVLNHNCEVLTGDVVVMHNVFTAEFRRRGLRGTAAAKALLNPVRAMRLAKERALAASRLQRVFVAVSEASAAEVNDLVRERHPVEVVPNGIDLQRYDIAAAEVRAAARAARGLSPDDRCVTFVGHEFARKGLAELIDALADLPDRFQLLVAGGESQDLDRWQEHAGRAGAADRVRFLGLEKDVPGLLAATDVFCIPSRYETMPMVALEALASGVPTVVSNRCPAQAHITPENGRVCEVDPASIATALSEAVGLERGAPIRRAVLGAGWDSAVRGYSRLIRRATAR